MIGSCRGLKVIWSFGDGNDDGDSGNNRDSVGDGDHYFFNAISLHMILRVEFLCLFTILSCLCRFIYGRHFGRPLLGEGRAAQNL